MENLYEKILLAKKSKLQAEQVLIENNIKIESSDEVVKILAINTSAGVDRPIEALSNECMVSGKIFINLVYETTNGEINNQVCTSPFTHKINNSEICPGAKFNLAASVVNSELESLINNQIKIVTTLNLDLVLIKNEEMEYLKDGNGDCFVKQGEKVVVSFAGQYCDKFEEKLETSVKGGIKKILLTDVNYQLKDWTSGPGFVSIEGELYARVLYVDNKEVGELQTLVLSKNIKHEIEVAGIDKEWDLDLFVYVIKENVEVEVSEVEDGVNLEISVPILPCVNSYECKKILPVLDIYSCKNVLSIQNGEGTISKNCKPEYIEDKIDGNIVLSEEQLRIDKYLATTNINATCSNAYVYEKMITIEGVVSTNVIYLNDETNSVVSVEVEIPFVINKKADLPNGVIIEPSITLVDADVMVKRGREIYFDAKVKAFINVCEQTKMEVITKIEQVATIEEKDGAIEVYFGKQGESLWDISKALKIPGEMITRQNPEISDPLDKDQNIAIYYQKNRK